MGHKWAPKSEEHTQQIHIMATVYINACCARFSRGNNVALPKALEYIYEQWSGEVRYFSGVCKIETIAVRQHAANDGLVAKERCWDCVLQGIGRSAGEVVVRYEPVESHCW